jgi:hypothetical protein
MDIKTRRSLLRDHEASLSSRPSGTQCTSCPS